MNDRHPPKMRGLSCACVCACIFLLHFSSSLNVFIFPFMPLLLQLLLSSFTSSPCCQRSCKHQSRQYSFEVVKQVKNNLQGQIHKFFFNVDFYGTVIQPFTVEVKCFFNTITELLKWMLIQLGVLMSNPGNKKDRLLNEIISSKKQNKSALTLALHFY